jgi:hypothetical protein
LPLCSSPRWDATFLAAPSDNMSRGYVLIFEPTHPNAQKRGYVAEHIKVMAAKLGRPLERFEECTTGMGSVAAIDQRTWNFGLAACSPLGAV